MRAVFRVVGFVALYHVLWAEWHRGRARRHAVRNFHHVGHARRHEALAQAQRPATGADQ